MGLESGSQIEHPHWRKKKSIRPRSVNVSKKAPARQRCSSGCLDKQQNHNGRHLHRTSFFLPSTSIQFNKKIKAYSEQINLHKHERRVQQFHVLRIIFSARSIQLFSFKLHGTGICTNDLNRAEGCTSYPSPLKMNGWNPKNTQLKGQSSSKPPFLGSTC